MNSAYDINMAALLSNSRLRKKLESVSFEEASQDFNCFISKCGDYALAKKNFPYDDIENPAQSVLDMCKECIKSNPQKNDTIVIYGLGLGYILDEVYERYPSKIFVYEPDINVIRFVVENVDLSHIFSDSRVYITDDCEDCCKKIGEQYLSHDNLEVVYLKNYGLIKPQELIKLSNTLFNICKSKVSDINTIKTVSKAWVKNIISNIERTSYVKPVYNLNGKVKEGTALVLSAGPSLLDNIEKIKNNRDKFTVFAVGKALKTLEENEIIPDFAVFFDAVDNTDWSKVLSADFIKQIVCLADIKADKAAVNLGWKDVLLYFPNNSDFLTKVAAKHNIVLYPAVGTAAMNALMCASQMGFKKVAFCGFDLAFKKDVQDCTGAKLVIEDNKVVIGDRKIGKTVVKSVSGEIVVTREDYAGFIPHCENNLKLIDDSVDIYNITDFGAYVRGMKYTTLDNIMPTFGVDITSIIEQTSFDKLSLKNDLESEMEALDELKDMFSTGDINYTKIYTLKKSTLLSEYTRYDVLELVKGEFTQVQLETFVDNILASIEEIKQMILKNLVKID